MFYDLDCTRVTLREYRWGTPLLLMPLAALVRLLRVRLPGSSDDPNVESLEPFRVPREVLPGEIQARFRPLEAELQSLGFVDPVYHAIDDPTSSTRIDQATYRHTSGTVLAKLHYRQWSQPTKVREWCFPQFMTRFNDGSYLVSSAGKADLLAPACVAFNRMEGASLGDLWRSHLQQSSLVAFGKTPVTVYSADQMLQWIEEHHALLCDFHVQRGVFRPREDLELVPVDEAGNATGPIYDSTTMAVLAEIRRIQDRKSSWTTTILILVVTIGAFLVLGRRGVDWTWMLMIVGVLFIHELGHLAAMWLFGYRNLKMFFIPFLGAAASGKNYNAAGWKKAMVSLMGPLPGIVLGGVLGIAGLVMGWKLAVQAGFLLVLLNGFNLLPIVPLDGGWIMHAVLFCRHPILDVAFRVIAAALLFLLGLGLDGFLIGLGVLMVLGLKPAYQVAKVTQTLRQRGLNAASPDAQTIPPQTAATIVTELRGVLSSRVGVKNTAQMALQVFESLNARPPEAVASLGLLTLYGGTAFLSIILVAVLGFGMTGQFDRLARRFKRPEPHPVQSDAVLVWKGPQVVAQRINTLVADFSERPQAEAAYRKFTEQLPQEASATLFGQTLFVTLPVDDDAAREKWLTELEQLCPKTFVDSEGAMTPLRLRCRAGSAAAAEAVVGELEPYFQLPWTMYPVPPWAKGATVTAEQEKARRTYLTAQTRRGEAYSNERIEKLRQKQQRAGRRGDQRTSEAVIREIQEALKEEQLAVLDKMRQEGAERWDLEVLDLCAEGVAQEAGGIGLADLAEDEEGDLEDEAERAGASHEKVAKWMLQLGQHLGQLPLEDGKPLPGSDCWSTQTGMVSRTGSNLEFLYLNFVRTPEGVPALVEWLTAKGCRDLQYELLRYDE